MEDEGRLVAGRYRLRTRVGAGAMGVVWQALDERLGRVVALKRLALPEGADAAEAVRRAAREARIAARLQHPNAVTVHDLVDDGGRPVLVMEYVPARTLADHGVLPPEQVARVGAQVAAALAAAHAAGVVHRDIKPGNVLLTADGTAKITDFGIARAVGDVAVTRTGLLAGTPAYLSPEVARGAEPGPASDVFALGATLYAALEGHPPFGEGDNHIALLHAVASGRYRPPAHAGPLTGLLTDMLRTDPAARPTMAQVAQRLRLPVPTRLDAVPVPAPARVPARRWIGVAAAAVVALVVTAVALAGREEAPRNAGGPPASTAPTTTATTDAAPAFSAARLQQAAADYYALLPEDTDRAWLLLGPHPRAQGRARYDEFWSRVRDFRVSAPPRATGADSVTVDLEYTLGQDRVTESRRLRLVADGGAPLIDSEEVVSSRTAEKKPPKKGKKDEDDD